MAYIIYIYICIYIQRERETIKFCVYKIPAAARMAFFLQALIYTGIMQPWDIQTT